MEFQCANVPQFIHSPLWTGIQVNLEFSLLETKPQGTFVSIFFCTGASFSRSESPRGWAVKGWWWAARASTVEPGLRPRDGGFGPLPVSCSQRGALHTYRHFLCLAEMWKGWEALVLMEWFSKGSWKTSLGPTCRISDPVGLEWDLCVCSLNKISRGADAPGLETFGSC